jgi:hypothetical protein
MDLIFLFGPAAAGKLTVARTLAERTGFALFHNHLVVDAVAAVFPFGSPQFIRLREDYWLAMFRAAAADDRSLIFTFAPEPTVAADFPARVAQIIEQVGGRIFFVALNLEVAEQERRLIRADRASFGKLRSVDILREIRDDCSACMAAMPNPALTLRTDLMASDSAAEAVIRLISAEL